MQFLKIIFVKSENSKDIDNSIHSLSLYHFIAVSLYRCITLSLLSLYHFIALSLYRFITLSLYHFITLSLYYFDTSNSYIRSENYFRKIQKSETVIQWCPELKAPDLSQNLGLRKKKRKPIINNVSIFVAQ